MFYLIVEKMNTTREYWDKRIITWPAGVFFNTKWELLCIIEREEKSRKRKGQLFVPAWKKRSNETMEQTMIRELWEETWIKKDLGIIKESDLQDKGIIPLETDDTHLDVQIFSSKEDMDTKILETNNNFYEHEIIQRVFINIREILEFDIDKIRPWLYEIFYVFYGCGDIKDIVRIENGQYAKSEIKRIEAMKQEISDLL